MLENIKKLWKSIIFYIWFIIGLAIIAIPSYYFTNKDLIIWNLWYSFFYQEISLTIIISILFGLFIWASLYKIKYFSVWKTTWWILGGFLWVLITWCPSCSITLASYLWFTALLSISPEQWLWLKIISVIILIYVNYDIIKNLETCKLKK